MTDTTTGPVGTTAEQPPHKRSVWHRLYVGETAFDFIGHRRRWFMVSGIVILVGVISLFTRGLNLGIDFKGGTVWEVKAPGVSIAQARDAMNAEGQGQATIQTVGGNTLRIQADIKDNVPKVQKVTDRLAKLANTSTQQVDVTSVGPSWGHEISKKAERALIFFFLAIALYISVRFEWKMALAALLAVVHDILVTVGIYSIVGFQVTPATVVAFLTILGYSLYDTIVVFDKIEENTRGLAASGRMTYSDTVNLSMNQVLMRSINTSLVAILPILSVLVVGSYILGATALEDFGLALTVGLLTGAYSSIFIASPLLAIFKEHEPRYAQIRQRIATRGTQGLGLLTPAAAAAMAGGISGGGGGGGASVASGDGNGSGEVLRPAGAGAGTSAGRPSGNRPPPRPRKKRRR
jgi:preprotein translocase subunit SecF